MKLYIPILLFLLFVIFILFIYPRFDRFTTQAPRIIHLIYFPWDTSTQKLKDDPNDFDHTAYNDLKAANPGYDVKLWTLPVCRQFVQRYYPTYENDIFNVPRPVMMVDILRLLITYHYGGIYWQYGSKQLVDMGQFLPDTKNDKNVKLFTEIILTDEFANEMRKEPIRNGQPEEKLRVGTQIFSAIPRHPYLLELFKTSIENTRKYKIIRDYDILFTTGNAMMSTVYDQVGKYQKDIEIVDLDQSMRMATISSNGSWRLKKI
jgi:mannosyltransferase OCH1-like enzyme